MEGRKCVLWKNKSASTLRDHAKVIGKYTNEPGTKMMKLGASNLDDKGRKSLFTAAHCLEKVSRIRIFIAQIVAQPLDVSIPHFRRCIHL